MIKGHCSFICEEPVKYHIVFCTSVHVGKCGEREERLLSVSGPRSKADESPHFNFTFGFHMLAL